MLEKMACLSKYLIPVPDYLKEINDYTYSNLFDTILQGIFCMFSLINNKVK